MYSYQRGKLSPIFTPHHPEYSIKEAIKRPVNEWKEILINEFEDSVFPQDPVIGEIKAELYRKVGCLPLYWPIPDLPSVVLF